MLVETEIERECGNRPQSAADESGTSSVTAMLTGGTSTTRALIARSRPSPPAQ